MLLIFLLLLSVSFVSCGLFEPDTIILWTDQPEFALYAQSYNKSQNRYKVEVQYFDSPAQKLSGEDFTPDVVVGKWLKSLSIRNFFRPLDGTFNPEDFYSHLLELGKSEEKYYLLPVSFNVPAIMFSRNNAYLMENPWTTTLAEIQRLGKAYNIEQNGIYSRMGFSPQWDDSFLFVMATIFGASFRESEPITWNDDALDQALSAGTAWIHESNTNIQSVDDFMFKYYTSLPAEQLRSGRILFSYITSGDFFRLPQERRNELDFRWIMGDKSIPLNEETVYFGMCKKSKAKRGATAFAQWFFRRETQNLLMEETTRVRLHDNHFGIANGFSGMRSVTEQVFPIFYPGLLGHIPPEEFLSPPNILPHTWTSLKSQAILPYLRERIKSPQNPDIRPLDRRIHDWYRINGQ
ncbi:lipoprotein [Spirochaetia bacterium]|nr:lipoprotein [Spirochaetia bacterium]GHU34139.1 lipoprotein [Spirochaetia bacterium]